MHYKKDNFELLYWDLDLTREIEVVDVTYTIYYEGEWGLNISRAEAIEKLNKCLITNDLTTEQVKELKNKIISAIDEYIDDWNEEIDESYIIQTLYNCYRDKAEQEALDSAEKEAEDDINSLGLERTFALNDPDYAAYLKELEEEQIIWKAIYKEVEALNLTDEEKEIVLDRRLKEAFGISDSPINPIPVVAPKRETQRSFGGFTF